ncbi:MAG: hypothetical protein R3E83_07710 [Burkholderiaceae bacterium]
MSHAALAARPHVGILRRGSPGQLQNPARRWRQTMSEQDLIIYSSLATVAVIFGLIVWFGVRARRRHDEESRTLSVDQVRELTARDRLGEHFLWCIWQGRLSGSHFTLKFFDETGRPIADATLLFIARGDVRSHFSREGVGYEIARKSLASNISLLRVQDSGEILMGCEHGMSRDRILARDLVTESFRIEPVKLIKETRSLMSGEREIGRMFHAKGLDYHVLVLSTLPDTLTIEQQLFAMIATRKT